MASEIRVDKINSLSGVGTVTLSPTGVDIAGITTAATLRATTGIVTSLTAGSLTSLGAVSGTTGTFSGAVSGTTGTFSAAVSGTTGTFSGAVSGTTGTFTSHVSLGDSDELRLGDGNDLSIYHDGSNSRIHSPNHSLFIRTGNVAGFFNGDGTEDILKGTVNGAVELYNDNTKRLSTTGNGVDIFGSGTTNNVVKLINTSGTSNASHHMTLDTYNASGYWSDLKIDASNIQLNTYTGNRATLSNTALTFASGVNIAMASGNGISFAATGNAAGASGESELLDDFEEGNHTVGVYGSNGGSSVTLYASENKLSYTKIGRLVTLKGRIRMDSVSYSGALRISLPYTVASQDNTNNAQMCAVATHGADFDSSAGTGSHMGMFLEPLAGNALAEFVVTRDNSAWAQATNSIVVSGTYLAFVLVYNAT